MSRRRIAMLAVWTAVLAVVLIAADIEARGGRGGGHGGHRGGGFSRGGHGGHRGGGFSRGGVASRGSISRSRSMGSATTRPNYGARRPIGNPSYGNVPRIEQRGARSTTTTRTRPGSDATQSERRDYAREAREDRQSHRDDAREDRQDYADDVRSDRAEYAERYDDERHEWYEDRWRRAVGTSLTVAAFSSIACARETVVVNGITYYRCASDWYTRAYQGGDVTYVVVNPPAGYGPSNP